MPFSYQTPSGDKYNSELLAIRETADEENVNHTEAKNMIKELQPDDEEKAEIFEFRIIQQLSAERAVKVKAESEERAEELVEDKALLVGKEPEITDTIHTESHKLDKVDEVTIEKLEKHNFYEEIEDEK